MDKTRADIENHIGAIDAYVAHPISTEIERDNKEREESLEKAILYIDPIDMETMIAHFVAIGELRGLRRAKASLENRLSELKEELKETEQES